MSESGFERRLREESEQRRRLREQGRTLTFRHICELRKAGPRPTAPNGSTTRALRLRLNIERRWSAGWTERAPRLSGGRSAFVMSLPRDGRWKACRSGGLS